MSPGFGRKPHRHGHKQRTPAKPAGSAGPANPNPSTPAETPAPAALTGALSASSSPVAGQPPAGLAAPGSPGAPTPAYVQVTAREYSFTLSRPEVPTGEVILQFINRGEDPHNLHLLEAAAESEPGSLPNTTPGTIQNLRLKLRPGRYTLFCSLPGHEAKGMKATLLVH